MFNLPASSFATLVFFRKAHSVVLIFDFEDAFVFLPIPTFLHKISVFHHLGSAVCARTTLYLFQMFLGQEISHCHWPCIPSCFSFSASFINFFAFTLSSEKYSHIPCIQGHSFLACHDAPFFSTTAFSTANSPKALDPLPSSFRCNTADTNCPCRTPYHPRPLPKRTARISGLCHCSDCHTKNIGLRGIRSALGMKLVSSASSQLRFNDSSHFVPASLQIPPEALSFSDSESPNHRHQGDSPSTFSSIFC